MKLERNTKQIGTVLGLSALLGFGALAGARSAHADRYDRNPSVRMQHEGFVVGALDRRGREMARGDYYDADGRFHRDVRGYLDRDGHFRPYAADLAGWYDRDDVFHVRRR